MKRRSVTFTDSPPEVIDNSNDCYNICAPTSNIFLWLQLAKIEERQRRYISDTQRQSQGHHCFRSLPDLNKQQHYLSVESKSSKSAFISNRGRNVFQQREQMDPVYLSISDLGMVVRPRPLLRAAIESVRNVTKMDTSWDLHGLCREGREKKLLQRRYAVSDYFLGRHRSALVTADAATQSPVKNALYRATELPVKENVDHGVINSNDKDDSIYSNDDTVSSKEIVLECKSSANDYNKNSASTGASNSSVHHRCTGDNRNDNDDYTFGVNYNVVNVIKCDGRVSESNSDCGKLAEQFLQRYHCHHLNDYKKSDSVAKTSRNWSWKNIGDENVISRRCYSLLNKPLQKKNYRRHHSSDARNTSFVFASTISNNSSMRDIISKHQWYYYPSMIYSKTQQQLVDGNLFLFPILVLLFKINFLQFRDRVSRIRALDLYLIISCGKKMNLHIFKIVDFIQLCFCNILIMIEVYLIVKLSLLRHNVAVDSNNG